MVLMLHPLVAADAVSAIAPFTIYTPNDNPEVEPKSVVVVSVKLTAEPESIAIICPALALEPDLATYSNHAPSYELVETEYIVVEPTFAVAVVDVNNVLFTVKPFVTVNEPVIMVLPFTSKVAFGDVVPIPTLPALVPPAIVIPIDPDVTKFILPNLPAVYLPPLIMFVSPNVPYRNGVPPAELCSISV